MAEKRFKKGDKVRVIEAVYADYSAGHEGVIDRVLTQPGLYDYMVIGPHFGKDLGWAFRDSELEPIEPEPAPVKRVTGQRFTKGDHIQVTSNDGSMVIKGTALDTRDNSGWAFFQVMTMDGKVLDFNLNDVSVDNLFRADYARDNGWSE